MIKVILTDQGLKNYDQARLHFIDASIWALQNCKSFGGYEIVETADVSYEWDQMAEYKFLDEKDAIWFKLRWV